MADDEDTKGATQDSNDTTSTSDATKNKTKRAGIFSRIWNVFRLHGDDFEKRLQFISKEEASVLSRIKRRSRTKTRITRNLIIFSVLFEVVAVGFAIMTTRSMDLDWKMRAFRVLPMFLLPALSSLIYSAFLSFARMCDRRDQKALEKLRAERQAKIDELKERTNYYTTQQLIQRYDPDPAAKAAAATVLASKLGADSGLKVYVGDESKLNVPTAKSNDVEVVQPSTGLRKRKQLHTRTSSTGSTSSHNSEEATLHSFSGEVAVASEHNQLVVVDHYNSQGSTAQDGGWIARIAAILVGEDPTQSYALICGNCHMHNGLARKEDFPFITYYCPHCHALNRPKNLEERMSVTNSPNMTSLRTAGDSDLSSTPYDSAIESVITSKSPVKSGPEAEEVNEMEASGELVS